MSCPKCGSNLVNYSCPPQCGACGYEFPETALKVLTEAEARVKYPHIYAVARGRDRPLMCNDFGQPHLPVELDGKQVGLARINADGSATLAVDDATREKIQKKLHSGVVIGFKGGDMKEPPSRVDIPADPTCQVFNRVRETGGQSNMGAMMKGLEAGTTSPMTADELDALCTMIDCLADLVPREEGEGVVVKTTGEMQRGVNKLYALAGRAPTFRME